MVFSDVEPELLKEPGACLNMTVMDYDVFSNDDIAGHIFFPLKNVLGLQDVVLGSFQNVPQETLNIYHPMPGGTYFEGTPALIFVSVVAIFVFFFYSSITV